MVTLDEVLAALRSRSLRPQRRGEEWYSGCPACRGGSRRLFTTAAGGTLRSTCRECGAKGPDVWRALGLLGGPAQDGPSLELDTVYPCLDPADGTVWTHTRTDFFPPRDGRAKTFRWQRGARSKRLIYRPAGAPPAPDGPLILTEGEADADAAAALGLAALGVVSGAPTVPEASALADCAGRDVVVWGDDDERGGKLARGLALLLAPIARSVRILDPDRLEGFERGPGCGAADWRRAPPDPVAAVEAAAVAPDAAPPGGSLPAGTPREEADLILAAHPETARRAAVAKELRIAGLDRGEARRLAAGEGASEPGGGWRWLSDVAPEPRPPVVASGLLWRNRLTQLWSREGVGKSSLLWAALAGITTGRDWLGGEDAEPATVVVMSEEPEGAVRARFDGLCGDPGRVALMPPMPLEALMAAVERIGTAERRRVAAVAIDTLRALWTVEGITDLDSGGEINDLVNRLAAAAHFGASLAWLFVHHSTKDGRDYAHSGTLGAAPDVNVSLNRVDAQPLQRSLTYEKCRWAQADLVVERLDNSSFAVVSETSEPALAPAVDPLHVDLVLGWLDSHGRQSTRQIREGVRRSHRVVRDVLDRLLQDGQIVHSVGGRNSDRWELSPDDRDSDRD